MSKLLSLKMDEQIFRTTERMVKSAKMSRNAYINKAVDLFNRLQNRKSLAKALHAESAMVARESLTVLHAFEALEDKID